MQAICFLSRDDSFQATIADVVAHGLSPALRVLKFVHQLNMFNKITSNVSNYLHHVVLVEARVGGRIGPLSPECHITRAAWVFRKWDELSGRFVGSKLGKKTVISGPEQSDVRYRVEKHSHSFEAHSIRPSDFMRGAASIQD